MARIVVVTHAYDDFQARDYLLRGLIRYWNDAGHEVVVTSGLGGWPGADLAILHVDLSVVPEAYMQAIRQYAKVVNVRTPDIRKRKVSRYLLAPGDPWTGPVVIKTDLNCGGRPERRAFEAARRAGVSCDATGGAFIDQSYPILRSIEEVPASIWSNSDIVVERFLPEQDARGFWMRCWVFFGDKGRCTRYLGSHPIVKSSNLLAREPATVPDELRAERERLGFDFGKLDFVLHDGRVILLDANRTPWAPPAPMTPDLVASTALLAEGINAWVRL